jgi:diadenylate cyclase
MAGRLIQFYESMTLSDLVQIAFLAVVLLGVWRLLGKTYGSGSFIGRGLALVLVGIVLVIQVVLADLDLTELGTLLDYVLIIGLLGTIVIFQPELRRGLMMLGRARFWRQGTPSGHSIAECLAESAVALSRERIGALIAMQREVSLGPIVDTGEPIDGQLTTALVQTIFYPGCPLHDGALILVHGRVTAAACQLPMKTIDQLLHPLDLQLGMRHRAAQCLSEQTDAIVLVVSEETGRISLAMGGRLERVLPEVLHERLAALLSKSTS